MKSFIIMTVILISIGMGQQPAYATYAMESEGTPYVQEGEADSIQPLGRSSYRSPSRSYNPGVRNPGNATRTTPTNPNTTRNPVNTAPRTGFGGFFGGMFGGLALGSLIGSLFNPFAGFTQGAPMFSLLSLVIWGVIIFGVVRLFRRSKHKGY